MGLQEAAELHGGDGVKAAGGLVEQEHARLVKQGAKEAEALNHAGGERAHLAIESFEEVKLFRELVDAEASSAGREMIEAAKEEQVFASGQAGIEAVVGSGMVAEHAADGARFAAGVVAGNVCGAAGGEKKSGDDTQKR